MTAAPIQFISFDGTLDDTDGDRIMDIDDACPLDSRKIQWLPR